MLFILVEKYTYEQLKILKGQLLKSVVDFMILEYWCLKVNPTKKQNVYFL